jgi:radical SAM superfamily enzyme YgiQ (UPF0313 family)
MKKILLINPPYTVLGGVAGQGGKNAPLNLAYLASFLRENIKGIEINIIDAEGLDLALPQLEEKINAFSPEVIGITCPTPVYYIVQKICSNIRKRDKSIKIILGGPHPTALPLDTLKETECDILVIGEGEITFLDLINAFQGGKSIDGISGIAYRDNDQIKINPRRELITDLDILPFPAKDLLPIDRYYLPPTKRIRSERATNMVTSRGCPFSCNFCMADLMWGNKTRFRSVGNVLDEIKFNVERYKLTEFSFHDEFFTLNKAHLFGICEGIIRNNLDVTWVCQTRAGALDAQMLKLMKKAGCGKIAFGFESGSEIMLQRMNKKENLQNAVESVKLCKEAGVEVAGAFILGYPGEDIRSIEETIKFSLKLDCDTAAFFIAIPYPGTKLYFEAVQKGYLKKNINWEEFAPISKFDSPMIIPNFTPAELTKWKKLAYKKYYLRPIYIYKKLKNIKSMGDLRDIFRGLILFKRIAN